MAEAELLQASANSLQLHPRLPEYSRPPILASSCMYHVPINQFLLIDLLGSTWTGVHASKSISLRASSIECERISMQLHTDALLDHISSVAHDAPGNVRSMLQHPHIFHTAGDSSSMLWQFVDEWKPACAPQSAQLAS